MTAVSKKYKSLVPEPLNHQFPDRVDKATAVEHHLKRKKVFYAGLNEVPCTENSLEV